MRLGGRGLIGIIGAALVGTTVLSSVSASASPDSLEAPVAAAVAVPSAADAVVVTPPAARRAPVLRPPAPRPSRPAPVPVERRRAVGIPDGPLGIPGIVLNAYKLAAERAKGEGCVIPWYLLAGIGRIESGHASSGNVDDSGTTLTPIRGPRLDGHLPGHEVVRDTDGGRFDDDKEYDRAVGPMQFMPGTWNRWGVDANGDGRTDPQNAFDATFAAARYLCAAARDLTGEPEQNRAVFTYNHSADYVHDVLTWAAAYATGVVPTAGDRTRRPDPESTPSSSSSKPSSTKPKQPPSSSAKPKPPCVIFCLPPPPKWP